MREKHFHKRKKKLNIMLVAGLLILAPFCALFSGILGRGKKEGSVYLKIMIGDEVVLREYVSELDLPFTYTLTTPKGGENCFLLDYDTTGLSGDEPGLVLSCIFSNCPDKLCVKTGKVNVCALPIICLPHRIVAILERD